VARAAVRLTWAPRCRPGPTPHGQHRRGLTLVERNTPRVTIRAASENRDGPCRPAMGPRCGWSTGSSRSSWWTAVAVRVCRLCCSELVLYMKSSYTRTKLYSAVGSHHGAALPAIAPLLPRSPHKHLGPYQPQSLTGAHEHSYQQNINDLRTLTIPRQSLQFYTKRCTNRRWPTRPDRAP